MASLYKKPIVKRDPKTGERIKAKSKKWWGRYRAADGCERRVPLAADKSAAQAMLNGLVRRVELERAGRIDPFEEHLKQPIAEHIRAFELYLENKGVTGKQVYTARSQVEKIAKKCQWKQISDIKAGSVQEFLGELRRSGLSAQTYNHYLKSAKQFTRWLVRDRRSPENPLAHLSRLNVRTDRRHDRPALSREEFSLLLEEARTGPVIESISGPDRAMMYVLAAWTGFRKGEIGSLTRRSLRLDDDPPTATVAASFSKRKRQDTQILHPELVAQLKGWLVGKRELASDEPLFPISGRVPGGKDRKTHKMMQRDLERARTMWLEEDGIDATQKKVREDSDFLKYCNAEGLYADFHANRHMFITNLERAGLSPKMAQTLARHSDIRLTLGLYTHIGLHDQTAAIRSLPGPPSSGDGAGDKPNIAVSTGTDGPKIAPRMVPTMVPSGAENGAVRLARQTYRPASNCTEGDASEGEEGGDMPRRKAKRGGTLCSDSHQRASPRSKRKKKYPRQDSNL